ncbi:MAG: IS1 family transposase [Chitinivibrionales bacterium]|nr:IS1 family transposase [Chitinivibrionales bacterium]
MPNILKREKQVLIVNALAEGSSIRSIERITGVHRDTIMRLGVRVGQGCTCILDKMMHGLTCKDVQVDEIWGFVGKKQKNVRSDKTRQGNVWTYVAIDSKSKAVPCFKVGNRNAENTQDFIFDLSNRLINRVQISSDSLIFYKEAIERGFGGDVDYGQIVKSYASEKPLPASSRYSPPNIVSVSLRPLVGNPKPQYISTSYVERQNLTLRMHCRRLTRLTNAFSKKYENFVAAIGLHFGYYNLVKIHKSLRMTPAMALGVSDLWTIQDLVDKSLKEVEWNT